uniref:PAS domain-containing protein n=1 Tax=viral metagenome TaxID=1070528 RepID=A0A6M3IPL0_9ZZZZ
MSLPLTVTGIADAAIAKNKVVKLVSPSAISREPSDYAIEISGAAGSTNIPFGVSHEAAAAADDPISVVVYGRALVMAGGTVAPGDPVKSDANGDVVKATGSAQNLVGYSTEDAVDNDIVAIFVNPQLNATVPA